MWILVIKKKLSILKYMWERERERDFKNRGKNVLTTSTFCSNAHADFFDWSFLIKGKRETT